MLYLISAMIYSISVGYGQVRGDATTSLGTAFSITATALMLDSYIDMTVTAMSIYESNRRGLNVITPNQCRAARALIQIGQAELAGAAGVSKQTLVDFERGARQPYERTIDRIVTALEAAGVEFIDPNGGGPGVRLRDRES